jgi:hypothetical protein
VNFGDQNVPPTTQNAPNSSFMHTYNSAGEYTARLSVTDVNGNVSTNAAQIVIDVTGGTPELGGAVSRKSHGAAGTFDIPLPLTGSHGLECRTGPTAGAHNIIVAFQNNLTAVASLSATATTTGGMTTLPTPTGGIINDAQGQPRLYSVNLTGVPDGSRVSLTLHGVADTAGSSGDITIPMDVLLGDANASGRTDNGDAIVVRNRSGVVPTDTATARADINCSGRVDNGDAIVIRNRSGQALP